MNPPTKDIRCVTVYTVKSCKSLGSDIVIQECLCLYINVHNCLSRYILLVIISTNHFL